MQSISRRNTLRLLVAGQFLPQHGAIRMRDSTDKTEQLSRWAKAAPVKLNPVHQRALEDFDKLPASAKVPVQVVAAREGVSAVTVWRRVKSGVLPAPVKVGGTTRWIVGELRAAA